MQGSIRRHLFSESFQRRSAVSLRFLSSGFDAGDGGDGRFQNGARDTRRKRASKTSGGVTNHLRVGGQYDDFLPRSFYSDQLPHDRHNEEYYSRPRRRGKPGTKSNQGRRKTEKIQTRRSQYHEERRFDYDGIHHVFDKNPAVHHSNKSSAPGFEYLGSKHSVKAALLSGSRGPGSKLFLQNDDPKGVFGDAFIAMALKQNPSLSIRFVSRQALERKHTQHRGAVLECRSLKLERTSGDDERWVPNDGKAGKKNPSVLFLDQVQDVHNLGAMLRSACFLGIDRIVVSAKESAPPSEAVSRISSGALELLAASGRIFEAKGSSEDFITQLKAKGWRTVVTAVAKHGSDNDQSKNDHQRGPKTFLELCQLSTENGPTLLVLGNEEKGCREDVTAACDFGVSIPSGMEASDSLVVDSMNVSAAAAVLMNRLTS